MIGYFTYQVQIRTLILLLYNYVFTYYYRQKFVCVHGVPLLASVRILCLSFAHRSNRVRCAHTRAP